MQHLFSILEQVDSTNNYAMEAIRKGIALDGSCWFTANQSSGKGQRGKTWESAGNENLAMSIVLKPKVSFIHNLFILNALISLEVRQICETVTQLKGFKIKWPNDIFFGDKKAAGILIENSFFDGQPSNSVIGVGMNVNQIEFGSHLPRATSLKLIRGKDFDSVEIARQLHRSFLAATAGLKEDQIVAAYNQHLYKKNEEVKLKVNTVSFLTTIKSVSAFGELITDDSFERHFNFGEVSWEI